jgi:hypothetical protein
MISLDLSGGGDERALAKIGPKNEILFSRE